MLCKSAVVPEIAPPKVQMISQKVNLRRISRLCALHVTLDPVRSAEIGSSLVAASLLPAALAPPLHEQDAYSWWASIVGTHHPKGGDGG